jgi:dTDP-glucose 4,6-dehydratase/UDP-glucuronate decarboxylase
MEYVRQFGLDARITRLFNTYGPRNDPQDGRVVPNFVMSALENRPLTIYGSGEQTRSFCYVSDTVEGLLRAMFTEGTKGEVFNIGNPDERTILNFADMVKEVVNSEVEIQFYPGRVDDPNRRCPDITKARSVLGWEPKVSLEDGIHKTAEYFRGVMRNPILQPELLAS